MSNLKRARKAKKLTQAEVAKMVGLTQSGYSDWERGETRIDSRSIEKLANIFDVPVNFIIEAGVFQNWDKIIEYKDVVFERIVGMIPPGFYLREFSDERYLQSWFLINSIYSFDEINMIKFFDYAVTSVSFSLSVDENTNGDAISNSDVEIKFTRQFEAVLKMHSQIEKPARVRPSHELAEQFLAPIEDKNSESKRIPVLGYVAAGIPIDAVEDIIGYEDILGIKYREGEYFGLQIKGHSMEPKISDGDTVIVRKQPDVRDGEIAVVLVNGDEGTVKKIKKGPHGVTLISSNPAYDPMFFTNEEIEQLPVQILGRVVELRAKL